MLFAVNQSVDADLVPPGLANVHHELDTLAGESNLCCLSVRSSWTRAIGKEYILEIRLGAPILIPVRLSLH